MYSTKLAQKENLKGLLDLLDDYTIYSYYIGNFQVNKLYNSPTINTNNPKEEVRLAKALAAYNWGRKNLEDHLVALKNAGKDIYSDNS